MRNKPLPGLLGLMPEEKKSPLSKKVPNCVPRGSGDDKLPKPEGDPCWDNYVQRGMKEK